MIAFEGSRTELAAAAMWLGAALGSAVQAEMNHERMVEQIVTGAQMPEVTFEQDANEHLVEFFADEKRKATDRGILAAGVGTLMIFGNIRLRKNATATSPTSLPILAKTTEVTV